jgi:hypothetical protein
MNDPVTTTLNADVQDSAREVLAIVAKSLMSAIEGGAEEARMALDAELQRQKIAHAFAVEQTRQEAVTTLLVELQARHDGLGERLRTATGPLRLALEHQLRTVERQQHSVLAALGLDVVSAPPQLSHGGAGDDGPATIPVRGHRRRKPAPATNGHAEDALGRDDH